MNLFIRLFLCMPLLLFCNACATKIPEVPPEQLKDYIANNMGVTPSKAIVFVDTKTQRLALIENNKIKKSYVISTGKKGLGQRANSFKTPLGLHRINEKIGHGVPKYGIFNRRQYVGDVWRKQKSSHKGLKRRQAKAQPTHTKDYISTRILRLEGLQPGFNKGRDWLGRNIDTEQRAVYIHGTTMEWQLGNPSTKGCVHMSADDVIKFFNEVPTGTLVWIR